MIWVWMAQDETSTIFVMHSLKMIWWILWGEGVIAVSIIHQQWKVMFDMFDSLIILAYGGQMVYYGQTDKVFDCFLAPHCIYPSSR